MLNRITKDKHNNLCNDFGKIEINADTCQNFQKNRIAQQDKSSQQRILRECFADAAAAAEY